MCVNFSLQIPIEAYKNVYLFAQKNTTTFFKMNSDTKQALSKLEKQCDEDYILITKNHAIYKGAVYKKNNNHWESQADNLEVEYIITKVGLCNENVKNLLLNMNRENDKLVQVKESKFLKQV